MHEPPADLTEADLAVALLRHWQLDVPDVRYAPVGYGGYHWIGHDPSGGRWFVTASRVRSKADLADLRAAMRAARDLAEAGLSFVVAPVADAAADVVVPVRPDLALSVFPYIDGDPGHWGDPVSTHDRAAITSMLAALHTTGRASATAPVRDPNPSSRAHLETSLRERGRIWLGGGPFSEPARALVTEHAAGLVAALAAFDDLRAQVRASAAGLVLTHGELHPGNLIRRGASYMLIDWDTAGLAPPERDLWWVLSDTGAEAARYAELTGREVSQAALALYRLRWDLDDIGLFLADFRAPHRRDQDSEKGLEGLVGALERVASREKFS